METPESMKAELATWNNGKGIDFESWVSCMGNFGLAAGYTSLFWPRFVLFDGYILREGFSETSLRGFESRGDSRNSVEWVMNHKHLADLHMHGSADVSADKLLLLGNVPKEIYEVKLQWQFPDNPCTVDFHIPEDKENWEDYQLSFWQRCHE